jgi:tetratricopeptide (TPR) repeat protein
MAPSSELLAAALAHHQAGRLKEAEQLCREIVNTEPACAEAWHLLGVFAYQDRRLEAADAHGKKALELRPDFVEALNNLGLVCHAQHRLDEAAAYFARAIAIQPDVGELHFNLGDVWYTRGAFDKAIGCYQQTLALNPSYVGAHINLGNVLRQAGRLDDSVASYRRALALSPNNGPAHHNLGIALRDLGHLDDASAELSRAAELCPHLADPYAALGELRAKQDNYRGAVAFFRRAIDLQPSPDRYNALALALEEIEESGDAIPCFRRALELDPTKVDALNNLGLALHNRAEYEAEERCYRRALELKPDTAEVHFNWACLMLLRGDFERGWQEYEWRSRRRNYVARQLDQVVWDGGDLKGKTILLHAEQGFGDTFQFIRYAPIVKAFGATVVVECQRPMIRLLKSCKGIDHLVGEGDDLPSYDCHASLMSLPRILKTSLATIPGSVPYLAADTQLVHQWRERLKSIGGIRVGINWRGRGGRAYSRKRDVPLDLLSSLAEIPDVSLVSLQREAVQGATDILSLDNRIVQLADIDTVHGAFMDTAAIMKNLDLVVTSDTSIAHLAGALGIPVWVALPSVPDWRWLLNRSDSPWYPTMRLFRQKTRGDWAGVFDNVRSALAELIRTKHAAGQGRPMA